MDKAGDRVLKATEGEGEWVIEGVRMRWSEGGGRLG